MSLIDDLKSLEPSQRSAIWASYLGWTLDAFDFFLMVFMLSAIAKEFGTDVKAASQAIFLTLAARPIGAFCFGWLAERFGRRPILMVDIILFSIFEFASGFAPITHSLARAALPVRNRDGRRMGNRREPGNGIDPAEAARARLRASSRAAIRRAISSRASSISCCSTRSAGAACSWSASCRRCWSCSSACTSRKARCSRRGAERHASIQSTELVRNWKIALYLVVLMTAFNFFSHGTQDLYPTFLQKQHHFDTHTTGILAAVMNVGAIVGGIGFGIWSEQIGRKRAIIIASLLALPVIPLWAFSSTPLLLGIGAFLIQVAVQGAWGIVPVHLNELSPPLARGLFPGFAYQLGNLIASRNAPIQAGIAESHGDNYALALALVCGVTGVIIALWTALGPERKDADFTAEAKALSE